MNIVQSDICARGGSLLNFEVERETFKDRARVLRHPEESIQPRMKPIVNWLTTQQ